MVDTHARREFAEALRQLLSGTINNIEFDRRDFEDTRDPGIFAIWYSVWLCYDDFEVHPFELMEGQTLDLKRCILFLHTDLEYEWPDREPGFKRVARTIRDMLRRIVGITPAARTVQLDYTVWPFARRSDYEEALRHPRLLAGRGTGS